MLINALVGFAHGFAFGTLLCLAWDSFKEEDYFYSFTLAMCAILMLVGEFML